MNRRMVFHLVGQILKAEAALLALPLLVSLIYKESCYLSFIITIGIALTLGFALTLISRPKNHIIYAKEGFVVVTLAWISMSIVGCLPFIISGSIPSFVDALFETVSGFTTTGSSIVPNVEILDKGILFWRSFTHWVGGMGVLVFVLAVIPNFSDRSIHLIRAEMPGPIIGKLVPKARQTARILYLIYIVLTLLEIIMLLFGGMSLFESSVHSFGTAGTGGFGIKGDGLAGYNSYCQWVIAVFMMIFGINFNLFYFILLFKIRSVFKSVELWAYIGIITVATGIITADIMSRFDSFADSVRHAFFQVASMITTTGYATADFAQWSDLATGILLLLMFIGGCAGSTAGGLKVARVVILFKMIRKEISRLLHPRSVNIVKMEGKSLDDITLKNTAVYFALYMLCIFAVFFILCFEPFGLETNFSTAVSCFNNIGPGLDKVGPMSNFSCYNDFTTAVLTFAMLLGRLEIFPVLICFSPSTWAKK